MVCGALKLGDEVSTAEALQTVGMFTFWKDLPRKMMASEGKFLFNLSDTPPS